MKKNEVKKVKERLGRVIIPPNKVHKDKKKYTRKVKHKNNIAPNSGNLNQLISAIGSFSYSFNL